MTREKNQANQVVMFSDNVGSWTTTKRVAERYGTDSLTLLFADTKMEDFDLYCFLDEVAASAVVYIDHLRNTKQIKITCTYANEAPTMPEYRTHHKSSCAITKATKLLAAALKAATERTGDE